MNISYRRKWKKKDIMLLMERLELYMSSGLTIDKALVAANLGVASWQCSLLERVRLQVVSGAKVSSSLLVHVSMSQTMIGLIEHGEASGKLSQAFGTVRVLLEKSDDLKKKFISAFIYPVIIGIFALVLTIGLVRGVMPQITPLLKSLHADLPLLTRIVIFCSDTITAYGLYIILGFIIMTSLLCWIYRKSYTAKKLIHRFILSLPLVGQILADYSWSLFLQSCGTLIDSGISVSEAYIKTAEYVHWIILRERLLAQGPSIRSGLSLGILLDDETLNVPKYIPSLIVAGEASGHLGSSLIRSSYILDRTIDHSLKKLTAIIEPLLMVVMGVVVGSIALSIMMPIYDMSRALQH